MEKQARLNYRLSAHLRDWIKRSEEFKSLFNVGRGVLIDDDTLTSFFFLKSFYRALIILN